MNIKKKSKQQELWNHEEEIQMAHLLKKLIKVLHPIIMYRTNSNVCINLLKLIKP